MKETQKRINEYKKALPHMKERVMAVAMLLVVAVTMMVSATFAWVTLSSDPEVTGLATTISANGNLEIALSDIDGLEPDETQVGDGNGAITATNLKWGNLVNLSHESYGLDYLTLRPASLNTAALTTSPMFAVSYAEDGRIQDYQTDFSFSNYVEESATEAAGFKIPSKTQYGVRAVSSVTYTNADKANFFTKQLETIMISMAEAKAKFSAIYNNSSYMNTVSALVGIHVTVTLDGTDVSCLQHMDNLEKMLGELDLCVDAIGQFYVDCINMREYNRLYGENKQDTYKPFTLADLQAGNYSNDLFTTYGGVIPGLMDYKTAALKMADVNAKMVKARQNADGDVKWNRDLKAAATVLCDMNTATLGGMTVSQLMANKAQLASMIMSTQKAVLEDGLLKDVDQLLGTKMTVKNVKITARAPDDFPVVGGKNVTITADITTGAEEPYAVPEAYNNTYAFAGEAANKGRGTPSAADTYAMVIDFWVRTNEENALLMLEGEVQYRVEYVPVTGINKAGETVPLYTYENADGEEVSVYKVTADDNAVTWYNADNHDPVDIGTAVPTAQQEEIKTPIGYEGVNRVWEELDDPYSDYSQLIQNGTSTTQGSGSCYIFYPETPEDQAQSLSLLKAMRVAFVSEDGKLLGQAQMVTDSAIAVEGRVVVPLQMMLQPPVVTGQNAVGQDITESYYITQLTQNEAKRVTAIIYLDGLNLKNSDVLAAGVINGQLNIQFGLNKMEKAPVKDDDVMKEHYMLSFANRSFEFESYNEETCKVPLELTMTGNTPSSITGSFISYISATQGARQAEFSMTYDDTSKTWKATVPFTGPGDFRLRSIQIDGVDILLPEDQIVKVSIGGVQVRSLACDWGEISNYSHMTADASYSPKLTLTVDSKDRHAIQGVFIGRNGKNVTVSFTENNGIYTGYANFISGGYYELSYVIIDGVYTQLNPNLYKSLDLTLNLRATVYLGQPVNDHYRDMEKNGATEAELAAYLEELYYGNKIAGDPNEKGLELVRSADGSLSMVTDCSETLFIDVYCIITDDQGNILTGLSNVELTYSSGGVSNTLDTNGTEEDTNAGYYAGDFDLCSNGVFSFYSLRFMKQGRAYTINTAVKAPTITAIQPTPMEYVVVEAPQALTFDLTKKAEDRVIELKLKNAAAASLKVTLSDGAQEPTIKTVDVVAGAPDSNNISTFVVQLPSDGYWEITDIKATNVFYNDEFHTEDNPLTLDKSKLVRNGTLAATFITEAYISVNKGPDMVEYPSAAFMTEHVTEGMTVEILGYNKIPLEQVLRTAGINEDVIFDLTYAMSDSDVNAFRTTYGLSANANLPDTSFGVQSTDDNGKVTMEKMNFLLPGRYDLTWTLTVGDKVYKSSEETWVDSFDLQVVSGTFSFVNVKPWKLPDAVITGVSHVTTGANGQKVYEEFYVNLYSDTNSAFGAQNLLGGVTNYYEDHYANVYIEASTSSVSYTLPEVTIRLDNLGKATSAYFTVVNGEHIADNGNADFNREYSFSTDNESVKRSIGGIGWALATYRRNALSQTVEKISMVYQDVVYTVPLDEKITINQQHSPVYLAYSIDSDRVSAPVTEISPDGRAFEVTLKSPTGQHVEVERVPQNPVDPQTYWSGTVSEKYTYMFVSSRYRYYTRTIQSRSQTTLINTYDATYTVSSWTIGGKSFAPGTTIIVKAGSLATGDAANMVAANQTATATLKRSPVLTDEDSTVETVYRYSDTYLSDGHRNSSGTVVTDISNGTWTDWKNTIPTH